MLTSDVLKNFRYIVIQKHENMSPEASEMYAKLFNYWKKSWAQLYSSLKSSETLNPNDFLMQDKVTAILDGDQVVAMHLLKDYEKSDFTTHPYFKNYSEAFHQELKNRHVRRLQSFQFFWVDLGYSKKATGINFAAIIASMSVKFQKDQALDASITIARKDIKVHETAEKLGFQELVPESTMHNVPVALMACFEPTLYPDLHVNSWADYFWNCKTEFKTTTSAKGVAA